VIKKALHLPVPDGPHHVLGESTYTYCSFVKDLMLMQGLAADACYICIGLQANWATASDLCSMH